MIDALSLSGTIVPATSANNVYEHVVHLPYKYYNERPLGLNVF